MTLRDRVSLAVFLLRFGGGVWIILVSLPLQEPPVREIAWVVALLWVLLGGPVIREVILPLIFPVTKCPGCRRTLPLVGRWKCGSHFVDSRDRHILAFHCQQGHRLEDFNCPRCEATVLVQRGDRQLLRHGSAVRLKTVSSLPKAAGLLLGHDQQRRPIHLPESRLAWHMAMTGGTGRGKSTLLANLASQFLQGDYGFTILDPGGDLAKAVLQQIPPKREDDVLYFDVSDTGHPCPLNILAASSDLERAVLSEELLGVFHKLHGSAWGPMLAHQLRMGVTERFKTSH